MREKTERTNVGVIVGRFQIADLTEGHNQLIEHVIKNHPKVVIFLGNSPAKGTRLNPLDFEARKTMVLEKYPNVTVLFISDIRLNKKWAEKLDNLINDWKSPSDTVTLYGSRESFAAGYREGKGKYPVKEMEQDTFISATQIRAEISRTSGRTSEFRKGVIWLAYNQYPKVYPTVDIAVWKENSHDLLLAEKPHEDALRFIGGFVDPRETYEEAAKREVLEESNIEVGDLQYIKSYVIDDWRYRREQDKIVTAFFAAKYIFGAPTARDDIIKLQWIPAEKIRSNIDIIVPEHQEMMWDVLKLKFNIERAI
jgi:bifunctional NMN adenylyltransferase/nudix hydrolase